MTPTIEYKPTVFVVDDDREMRHSLQALLGALGFEVRTFSLASSFHRYYRSKMPGCLLLDVRMPVQDGLSLYDQLLRERKRLPVIFITAHADVTMAVRAMKTGAIEFLEKPFDRHTLKCLIDKALSLTMHVAPRDAEFAAIEARIDRLSSRERETLELVLLGESNKTMAARLLLSERAIEMRRAAIMRKLQVRSVAELFDLAVSHRILAELRCAADNPQLR